MTASNGSMKVFGAATAQQPDVDQRIPFGLIVTRNGARETHKFGAPSRLSLGVFRWITALAEEDPDDPGNLRLRITDDVKGIGIVFAFFSKVLTKADFGRFEALVDDPDVYVNLEDLAEIIAWMVEIHTGRPTERLSSSGTGQPSTSPPSTETTSPPASTSSASTSSAT